MKKTALVLALCSITLVSCAHWRAITGGAIGAGGAIGGVIGHQLGNTAAGAIIGAAIGGTAGRRITTHGYGESQPVADNSLLDGRATNHRVEVAIFANNKLKQAAKENKQL